MLFTASFKKKPFKHAPFKQYYEMQPVVYIKKQMDHEKCSEVPGNKSCGWLVTENLSVEPPKTLIRGGFP